LRPTLGHFFLYFIHSDWKSFSRTEMIVFPLSTCFKHNMCSLLNFTLDYIKLLIYTYLEEATKNYLLNLHNVRCCKASNIEIVINQHIFKISIWQREKSDMYHQRLENPVFRGMSEEENNYHLNILSCGQIS
jgi:hypothetical protein